MIITIDGPAGSGKSTLAKALAERLEFEFLDTGAMYRAVGYACLAAGVTLDDPQAVADVASTLSIKFDGGVLVCDGKPLTDELRTEAVSQAASQVAGFGEVRRQLVRLQRRIGQNTDLVTEGRDQGSVVFPTAECKFYFHATVEERARRRWEQLPEEERRLKSVEELTGSLTERDERDSRRDVGPLRIPEGAHEIDTERFTEPDLLDHLENIVLEAAETLFPESSDEPVFVNVDNDDPELAFATRSAQNAFPDLVALLIRSQDEPETICSAKLKLLDPKRSEALGEDRFLYLWVTGVAPEGELLTGVVFELPPSVDWLEVGQTLEFEPEELQDWMVIRQGELHGGYTLRVLRERMPPGQRAEFDRFIGAESYAPLDD